MKITKGYLGMQREKLSSLMDGEILEPELISTILQDSALKQRWESYHLIRDTLRGDTGDVVHFDIASQVALALEKEPVQMHPQTILESQPTPESRGVAAIWQKIRPWASQITQVGMAACVSLAVIVGVQQYNKDGQPVDAQSEYSVFNTVPVGAGSPVSLNISNDQLFGNEQQNQAVQRNQRINSMLQQYEIERRSTLQNSNTKETAPISNVGAK